MKRASRHAPNLAWKFAAVLSGWAGPGLLDTYQVERRPNRGVQRQQSWRNMALMPRRDPARHRRVRPRAGGRAGHGGDLHCARRSAMVSRCSPRISTLWPGPSAFSYPSGALISMAASPDDRGPSVRALGAPGARSASLPAPRRHPDLTLDLFDTSADAARRRGGRGLGDRGPAPGDRARVPLRATASAPTPTCTTHRHLGQVGRRGPWGASLVRPDGHVAWRTGESAVDSARL